MPRAIWREIKTDQGTMTVHVNRRGCTGKWTPADDAALRELVQAAVKQMAPTEDADAT